MLATRAHDADVRVRKAMHRVNKLDLSPITRKLIDGHHGLGWPIDKAELAESLYRCFLALELVHAKSKQRLAPPVLVDEYWHQHILDTRKYAADCKSVFGSFLHHFPYFGMRGPEDEAALERAGEWTMEQLRLHFGEAVAVAMDSAYCSSCGRCSACG